MNYLGKVVTTFRDFYNDLNPATLSGAIDVVVIEKEDGSFACSPFHVRFGKRGVFNRREKIVDITINEEPVDLHMKLGETGEAFFVERQFEGTEGFEGSPAFATSPLPSNFMKTFSDIGPSIQNVSPQLPVTEVTLEPIEYPGSNSCLKIISEKSRAVREFSESPKRERHESGNDSDKAGLSPSSKKVKQRSRRRRRAKINKSKDEEIFKMDLSEEEKDQKQIETDMEEASSRAVTRSGSLPDILNLVAEKAKVVENVNLKQHRRNLSSQSFSAMAEKLHVTFAPSFHVRQAAVSPPAAKSEGRLTPTKRNTDINSGCLSDSEVDLKKSETQKVPEDEGANVTWQWGQLPEKTPAKTNESIATVAPGSMENVQIGTTAQDEQEKRSYLRGMLNIWRRSKTPVSKAVDAKAAPLSSNTPEDSGKYLSDLAAQELSQSQKDKYLALDVFVESNQQRASDQPLNGANSPESVSGASSVVNIAGANIELTPLSSQPFRAKVVEAAVPNGARSSSAYSSMGESPQTSDTESDRNSERGFSSYRKTLRLTSDQISKLPLQYGANEAEFCIVTKFQGSARCRCHIFLWRYDDKIVISDVDGTITKSDVLGHILPIIGSTWAQAGVAGLYHRVANNGYKFLYLSSRAIGQASFTRDHLKSIIQENTNLPDGPLLLSPKSLFLAFHQEVIVKKPEEFKIACLLDIKALFPEGRNPFFAAYGNKTTDLVAYRTVGVPSNRIFTINYQGQLKQELTSTAQSSYSQQSAVVDMLFPPLRVHTGRHELVSEHEHSDNFSSFTYWKTPLPEISSLPAPPPEPEPKTTKTKKLKETVKTTGAKSSSPAKSDKNSP